MNSEESQKEGSIHSIFHEVLSLNTECLKLNEELLKNSDSHTDSVFQFSEVSRLRFWREKENDTHFILQKFEESLPNKFSPLSDCFFKMENIFKIHLPKMIYSDLSEEIRFYQYLDEEKGIHFLYQLKESLLLVREVLSERIENLLMKKEIKKILESTFNFGDNFKKYYHLTQEPFVKNFQIDFEIELKHTRALKHIEMITAIIEEYLEPVEIRKSLPNKRSALPSSFLPDSKITSNPEYHKTLFSWVKENLGPHIILHTELLYRASRDGFKSSDFHSHCDNRGSTIVLVKSTSGKLFGGFSNIPWHSRDENNNDDEKKSFLFSLDRSTKYNFLDKGRSIRGDSSHGPIFGSGSDLMISHNCNLNSNSYSETSSSFSLPSKNYLSGSRNFQVEDYEVWRVF